MGLKQWAHELQKVIPERMAVEGHGTMPLWQKALQGLPQLKPSQAELKAKVVALETEVNVLRKIVTNVCEQLDIVDNNS